MDDYLPLSRQNRRLFALGLTCLAAGYGCLVIPPVDGFASRTAAPLLLVLGYCVLLPLALLLGSPSAKPGFDPDHPR